MAIDAQLLANIGQSGPDVVGSIGKAYTLADTIDRQQLNKMTLQSTRDEQADLAKIKTLSQQYDLSNPDQRHELSAKVQKEVGGKYAMDFMRQLDEADRRKQELSSSALDIHSKKAEILVNATRPFMQQVAQATQAKVDPQIIETQMLGPAKQVLERLTQEKLPNGEPVLNKNDMQGVQAALSGPPGSLLKFITGAYQSNVKAQQQIAELQNKALQGENVRSEIKHRETMEEQGRERLDIMRGKAAEGKGEPLSADAIRQAAERIVGGEPRNQVIAGYGRGAQGAENIRKIDNAVAAMTAGKSGTAITEAGISRAGERRTELELSAREGKIATAVQEAQNFAGIALDASAKVPRGQFLPWNKLSQYKDTQLQSPELASFKAATLSLVNAYTRAVGGGTVHVADKEHANEMLNTAQSPEAYQAVVKQLITETQAALAAPGQVRAQARNQTPTPAATPPQAGSPPPSSPSSGGGGPTMSAQDQSALAWANAHPSDPRAAAIKQKLGVR